MQSIQGVTLGTSYVSGSLSLIAARVIAMAPSPLANVGAKADLGRGVKLHPGVCLLPAYISSSMTLTNTYATLALEVR